MSKLTFNVALFVGSDINSHLLLNRLLPRLQSLGHRPHVYLPHHRRRRGVPVPDLEHMARVERGALQNILTPYLETRPFQEGARYHTAAQLGERLHIPVDNIPDINDPGFIAHLAAREMQVGISLRCYQRFGEAIIDYFQSDTTGGLWNLHPGLLPAYRGVMTIVRAMANGETHHGYTLHHVDKGLDTGPMLSRRCRRLDYSACVLTNMYHIFPLGVEMVVNELNSLAQGRVHPAIPQNQQDQHYYSFPTPEECADYSTRGIRLVDTALWKHRLARAYTLPHTCERHELSKLLEVAFSKQED